MGEHLKQYGRTTFASLSVRNYRLYFFGQSISLSGTWMQTVAFSWLVLTLTGSGVQLGFVLACQFLPILLLGLWGGLLVDRFHKRRLLYVTQVAFAVLAVLMGILTAGGWIAVWMVYAFSLCFGVVNAVDNPTRQAFVSELVGHDHVKNAVTLNSIVNNLARVVGPAIGGIVIASFGVPAAFFLNAFSFAAVIAMLWFMRDEELMPATPIARKKGQLREGLLYALASPSLRTIMVLVLLIGTLAFEFQVSLPLLASVTFLGDAASYAALFSAMGVGAVAGGLFAAGRKRLAQRDLIISTFLFGASLIGVALMPTLAFATLGMVLVGFFSINMTSLANTMLQLESAPELRGRIMSLWTVGMLGTTPIGAPTIGFIGEHMGPRWGLIVGGAAAIAAAVFLRIAARRGPASGAAAPLAPAEAQP